MKIIGEYDYRKAKSIIKNGNPKIIKEIYSILNDSKNKINLKSKGKQRDISEQIKLFFIKKGWKTEQPSYSIKELRYDLLKDKIPIEIEIGHERLVYADFFEFLIDYSNSEINAAIMIVTGNPKDFGHTWHNSLQSTKRKLESIKKSFLVPILVIGIEP